MTTNSSLAEALAINADLRAQVAQFEQQLAEQTKTIHEQTTRIAELERFAAIVEQTTDFVGIADPEGHVLYLNPGGRQMVGLEANADVSEHTIRDFQPHQSINEARSMALKDGVWRVETTIFTQDQREIPVSQVVLAHKNAEGVITSFSTIARDMTDYKELEQTLRSNEVKHSALLSAIPDLLFVFDSDGIYRDYKAERDDELMVPPEQFLDRSIDDVLPAPLAAQVRHFITQALTTRTMQEFEYTVSLEDGPHVYEARMVANRPDSVVLLARDITLQRQAATRQALLQQRIIESQQAALHELSTPLIPIADHVVVMPLIGAVDSHRAQHIMEALLEGVASHGADTAIVDITGVRVVDTHVATTLLQAAQAVQMLGAQVVLTGIKPEVAQTLVSLGVDFRNITTRSTLQRGIAFALGSEKWV